jgi:glutathione synthase/RimK-type ligase-like ATP-grasp enzyme
MKIGFITCADLSRYFPSAHNPLLTHDDQAAADALATRGHDVLPVVWGAPAEQLVAGGLDLLVIRSPWDYMDSRGNATGFLAWLEALERAGLRVQNPLSVVRWNLDKHYLADLAQRGVPTVPTRYLPANAPVDLHALRDELGELVLKPCISAAAKDTFRLAERAEVEALIRGEGGAPPLEALRAGRDFMVQPFLSEVQDAGEWSLVFFEGVYSHAVLKRPASGNWLVQDELGGSVVSGDPRQAVRRVATLALAAATPAPLLCGRVDVIPIAAGELVSELELIEPELFFLRRTERGPLPDDAALEAFCAGLERRAGLRG